MEAPSCFEFPFPPYTIQQEFMAALYTTLEQGGLGIFESPTGTGKSLSLCCGALQWLKDHEQREQKQLQEEMDKLTLEVQAAETDARDWLSEEYSRIQAQEQKNSLRVKLQERKRQEDFIKGIRQRRRREDKGRERWQPQKDKKTQLEDEDTGGEHKEDLQDTDLILQEKEGEGDDEDDDDNEDKEEEQLGVKIFFCSRTHSQLSQFVNEIKRTVHSTDIRVVSLASRQQYCVNPAVLKLHSSQLINERCLELQKQKKGKPASKSEDGKTVKRAKCGSGCPFYNQASIELLRDEALTEIKDVEELVTASKQTKACPYYSARAAIKYAQVVVVPYQTLLHEPTRRANGISLKGNVLIIDEAHNLLDTLGHIHSAELSGRQLSMAHQLLSLYRDKYRARFGARNLLHLNQLIFIVGRIFNLLKWKAVDEKKCPSNSCIFTMEEFVLAAEIDHFHLRPLLDFCKHAKLAQKLHGFSERYNTDNTSNKSTSLPGKNVGVQTFLNKISEESSKGRTEKHAVEVPTTGSVAPERQVSVGSAVQTLLSFLECLTAAYRDGRVSTLQALSPEAGHHKFILLNPAAQFKDIVREARAIIVAGGTMQPMSEFRDQLFVAAGAAPERIREFCCGHVVPPDNILAVCLSQGPAGRRLNFNFDMRNTTEMLDEIGRILQNMCNIVPGGIVCFFPSYDYEKTVYKHLEAKGILHKIQNKKKVFREPKTTAEVDQVLEEYSKVIRKSKEAPLTGALMLSVIGGKLSEGLNFSDDLGRCVMVVGLPYPNIKSTELQEKMKYLKENISPTAGSCHYDNLCFKAVNQCIGRAVRHAADYATVLLLDERYSREQVSRALPHWIQRSLLVDAKFGSMFGNVSKFFASRRVPAAENKNKSDIFE